MWNISYAKSMCRLRVGGRGGGRGEGGVDVCRSSHVENSFSCTSKISYEKFLHLGIDCVRNFVTSSLLMS